MLLELKDLILVLLTAVFESPPCAILDVLCLLFLITKLHQWFKDPLCRSYPIISLHNSLQC